LHEPAISAMWPFAREEPDGHPPFYAVIGNLGWWLGHWWLPVNEAHRFGPVVLFSLTSGVMFLFMARRWGRLAAIAATGAWILMPRVFAHAHLASYDSSLACLWFLCTVAFWKAQEGWIQSFSRGSVWSITFAILLALAAATKFTGWLIPLPLLVWSIAAAIRALQRDGRASLLKLSRVSICLAIPVMLAPTEVLLVRKIREMEAGLQPRAAEDSQARARRAADAFRSSGSTHPLNFGIFVAAAAWIAIYGSIAILGTFSKRFDGGVASKTNRIATNNVNERASGQGQWPQPPRRIISPLAETWAAAALVPALTVALVPNWWHDPLRGIAIFLWSNLTRQNTTWIPTQFFGTLYEFSLPWYNTLAWVALTMPPLTLLFVMLGILVTWCGWRQDRQSSAGSATATSDSRSLAWLLFWNAAALLIIRALPGSPGHDGERQLLASFPFIACLAGVGVEWLRAHLGKYTSPGLANWLTSGLVLLSLIWSAAAIWHYRTAPLAYYTELIGGVRGAARLGLEPTYYWDALDRQAIEWLNANTLSGEKVRFCNYSESLGYLRHWGILRAEILPLEPGVDRWYILQNRPGLFLWNPIDRWLAESGRAAYTHEIDGVPLIWIFPYSEYERAIRETQRATP
jgi:4-amino-4-deoxy-L-arabinose transferase-like glycosyltransferase